MNFDIQQLRKYFAPHIFERGVAIHHQNRVNHFSISEDASLIEAQVMGSQRVPYQVQIRTAAEKNKNISYAKCSCPMSYQCKHIAATLIKALEHQELAKLPPEERHIAWLKDASQTAERQTTLQTNHWLENLNTALEKPDTPIVPKSKTHTLIYQFSIDPKKPTELKLILMLARKIKKGGHGLQKSFSSTQRTHFQALLPVDHEILHALEVLNRIQEGYIVSDALYESEYSFNTLDPSLFQRILETNRCYWLDTTSSALPTSPLYPGMLKKGELQWSLEDSGTQKLICLVEGKPIQVLPLMPLWYLDHTTHEVGQLELPGDPALSKTLLFAPPVTPQTVSEISAVLNPHLKKQHAPLPHRFETRTVEVIAPKPRLHLLGREYDNPYFYYWPDEADTRIIAIGRVSFLYEKTEVAIDGPETIYSLDKETRVLTHSTRQFQLEGEHINFLLDHPVSILSKAYPQIHNTHIKKTDFLIGSLGVLSTQENFLQETVPLLKAKGWDIIFEESFPVDQIIEIDDWYTELTQTSEYDWFNMELGVMVNGQKINILPLIVNLIQQFPNEFTENALNELTEEHLTLPLNNHQKIRIPAIRVKGILATLTELYDKQSLNSGQLSLYRTRITQLSELTQLMETKKMQWLGGDALIALSEKIANFSGIVPVPLPKQFKGKLRDYQQKGVDWLNFLREYRLGGILADDMGLGKTVQTLAHLMIEKTSGRLNKPCLIIAPTSLMENWRSEAVQFAPSLKIVTSQGQSRKKLQAALPTADLILTTYPLIVRDKEVLLEHEYYMIILDEAQCIKNANTKAYLTLQHFKSEHRLCLTGTPMENHLGELWSLFNFLSPGLLGNSKQFTQLFRTPIEKQGNLERRRSLNQRIRPYMLRRTKAEVAQELPTKTEIIHHIILEEKQRDLYESIRLAMESKVRKAVEAKGLAQSQIVILDALLKLRQTCSDPRLLKLEQAKKVEESAKLKFLMNMLTELVEEGRKILLFSSFTSMLSLIELELKEANIDYVTLTGSTVDRSTPIKCFQAGEVPVFLISLKAGGTGLNLTAADTVIFYDPWWNPAAEAQASDRAHRIGQTKPVFVYKLVTTGTVEEKILLMQQKKRALMASLFEESNVTQTRITKEDLNFLFQPLEPVTV